MEIGVIGAGIAGVLTAVGLARDGHRVTMFDRRDTMFSGASANGEGKVHLGLVYALGDDATLATMLGAALRFDRSVDALLGAPVDWDALRGGTFTYAVADDSLVPADRMIDHSLRIDAMRAALIDDDPTLTYLGAPLPSCGLRPVPGAPDRFDSDERTVDVQRFFTVLAAAIARSGVRFEPSSRVVGVERSAQRWDLEVERSRSGASSTLRRSFDVVVNCAWDDAVRLDRRAELDDVVTPNLRIRTFVHGRLAVAPIALTIVHGPYGDIVVRPDGRTYAAWYPTGLLDFAVVESSPPTWDHLLDDPEVRRAQIEATISNLVAWLPELGELRDAAVSARVVVAHGATDIDDRTSELHLRSESGIVTSDGWISIRSTKFTTAPAAALEAVVAVREGLVR